jgi:hypothetical protein
MRNRSIDQISLFAASRSSCCVVVDAVPLLVIPRVIHTQAGHRRDHWSRSFPILSERAVIIRLPTYEYVRTSFTHVVRNVIHAVRPVLAVTMFKLPQSIGLHRR